MALICTLPAAPLRQAADAASGRLSELLFGEAFEVWRDHGDWVLGRATDGTEGFAPKAALSETPAEPTRRVRRPGLRIFHEPVLTEAGGVVLPMNARVALTGRTAAVQPGSIVAELAGGGWAADQGLAPLDEPETDPHAVGESLLGAPWLHGGRTWAGMDGPGLVQAVLGAGGHAVSRSVEAQTIAAQALGLSLIAAEDAYGLAFADGRAVVMSMRQMAVVRRRGSN